MDGFSVWRIREAISPFVWDWFDMAFSSICSILNYEMAATAPWDFLTLPEFGAILGTLIFYKDASDVYCGPFFFFRLVVLGIFVTLY